MKTHIEISAKNLVHNLKEFEKLTDKKIMLAVKANAYGHGLKEVVSITRELSPVAYYAVDTLEEALAVKAVDSKKKILVIGWADRPQLKEIILNGFELVVPSIDYLKQTAEISKEVKVKAKIHVKVETGTMRLGMPPPEAIKILKGSRSNTAKHVEMIGIYSHFANIEDTTDHSFAQYQLEIFNNLLQKINHKNLLKHFSCSASTLLFPETHFDIVRLGISAYGFWPSKPTYVSYIEKNKPAIRLKPVLSWYSKAAQVKTLKKGESIGYGLTYKTFDRSRIIVVPVGYYDGYDRKLSNVSTIIVNGVKAPIRGRICMNMLMAEISHIKTVKPGDRVTLIGEDGKEKITADDLADLAGTINYEVLSRLNPLIPRLVI
ncbi:MAG: alanine racemase [Candidatus Aminicenantes bacterium]|nr:MAG: alanine racemase [Candidatus Aminicenantes bacterium]